MMEEKKITIRQQKVVRDHTKQKLIFYGILAGAVVLAAIFAPYITP